MVFKLIIYDYHTYIILIKSVFLSAGRRTVYEYKNDSLYRIDKSFEFQSRFNSFNFVRGDSIISVGGSGEFNVQNNIIYFTDMSLEWLVETRYDYRESDNRLPLDNMIPLEHCFFNLDEPKRWYRWANRFVRFKTF